MGMRHPILSQVIGGGGGSGESIPFGVSFGGTARYGYRCSRVSRMGLVRSIVELVKIFEKWRSK